MKVKFRRLKRARLTTKSRTPACHTGLMISLRPRDRHANSVDNGMHIVLPQWRTFKNIFARISRTGAGANIVCLVVESAPNIEDEVLVKIQ